MDRSLYERLGGNQGIKAIVNDVVDLHLVNPVIGERFRKSDPAKLKATAHEFFCAGSGGPEKYSGRDMRAVHSGMNISDDEFTATVEDILLALDRNGVGQREKDEVVAILNSLKADVVRL